MPGRHIVMWLSYLIELHTEKDLAYGDAWCRRGEAAGIFPNVARKFDRWSRIRRLDIAIAHVEPLDDTLADLLIYSVKYLLWLLERYPNAGVVLPTKVDTAASVADTLTLIAEMPIPGRPDQVMADAFERLESIFLAGRLDDTTALDRVSAIWSLAIGAWAAVHVLPAPGDGRPQTVSPQPADASIQDLYDQLIRAFVRAPGSILLLGLNATAMELRARLTTLGLNAHLIGIAQPGMTSDESLGLVDWAQMGGVALDYLVVTSDQEKEALLAAYALIAATDSLPTVILTGVAHLAFRESLYEKLDAPLFVPSYATGYAFTRVHIFQHLQAAAAAGLRGAIVEFGAFKGGTTAWLARVAGHFNLNVPILAFDSWDGFPPRRSLLDMYQHPRCVFTDLAAVRAYLEPLGVELVAGDISDTASSRLADEPILLAFVDTDNFSPAVAALTALVDNVVPGGAIVFDHYTTTPEYLYTLGERMAGRQVLGGREFINLHGTGVFIRLPKGDAPGSS